MRYVSNCRYTLVLLGDYIVSLSYINQAQKILMIYRLLLLSEENDFFRREIKIDSEATFLELNDFILKTLKYDTHELSTFYVCDEDWQKEQEVTLMDMGFSNSDTDSYLMSETRLEELIENKGDHLLFVFDMLSERGFFIELMELLPGTLSQPELTLSEGKAPEQTSSLEFAETRSVGGAALAANDFGLDDDLYGDDVDLDDLDPEGFTELDSLQDY